jgi:hypothetical protein
LKQWQSTKASLEQQRQSREGEKDKLTAKRECKPFATRAKNKGDKQAETAKPQRPKRRVKHGGKAQAAA